MTTDPFIRRMHAAAEALLIVSGRPISRETVLEAREALLDETDDLPPGTLTAFLDAMPPATFPMSALEIPRDPN